MPYYGLNIEIIVHFKKYQPVNVAYKVLLVQFVYIFQVITHLEWIRPQLEMWIH